MKESVMKIQIVVPITTKEFRGMVEDEFRAVAGPGVEINVAFIERGPASIESRYEEMLAVPDTVAKIQQAEREGAKAVIIDCMGDPGLGAAREAVSIPVIGPAQAAMHLAALLGHKFSVVTVLERLFPLIEDECRLYGLIEKLASCRAVSVPVLELEKDRQRLVDLLVEESVKAVKDDGAHVIVFGCTGMAGCAGDVQQGLAKRGYADVPVVDPTLAALKLAQSLVELGLSHSKRTYGFPPKKEITGY
jgi:allantoin racemase